MNIKIKKKLIIGTFILAMAVIFTSAIWPADVRLLPMRGPIATVKITPSSTTATAYLMDMRGQKTINFKSNANVAVYIASSTAAGDNGWPLLFKGDSITVDIKEGTTIYFKAEAANPDIRVILVR